MNPVITFQQYLQSAFIEGPMSTDEVIEFVLPLFEEVLSFHEAGQVGSFEKPDTVFLTNGRLDIDEAYTHPPQADPAAVQKLLDHQQISGYSIASRVLVDLNLSEARAATTNLDIQADRNAPLTHPVYLPGYGCYELQVGHHDARTDIFCLGLILGSAVMGLDLYDLPDLEQFAQYRVQPAGLNPRVHPTLAALVTEMTELDRRKRSADLAEVIQRLKFYRDYDPQRNLDLASLDVLQAQKPASRRSFILSKLRNRLFDTSRRNRLLHYKPNARFVNLTVSSVPLVLHYQSVNPQLLFTWNEEISRLIIRQADLSLNKYLRFEDHPYLNSQLTAIRHQSDLDKKEYGFSQLKLVVAFLHWHNLKENPQERIQSPLLLLPVELERRKSLKEERFTLKITDNAATVNPVLSNYLKDLYCIQLPESIDFDNVSIAAFFTLVQSLIDTAKQGVKLNYIDQPRIRIVHTLARQTVNNYRKRLKQKGSPAFHQVEYSYSEDDFRPLGLELFRQKVAPQQSGLAWLLGESENESAAPSGNFAEARGRFELTDGESNPYSWDFDVCNIVLGNFNYKKMSLVRDYNIAAQAQTEHAVFDELFSTQPRRDEGETPVNDPAEWFHVITADPTQAKAVMQSRTGKSYVIQGPPGTGKSQTITNLVADFLAMGKTVLFICEKRAALDVVYHRLQQNKLAELCCYIHDSQGDKKEFIKDLRTVYEDFIKNKPDLARIHHERTEVLNRMLQQLGVLRDYHNAQRAIFPNGGKPLRDLLETLTRLQQHVVALPEAASVPFYDEWLSNGETISQLGRALEGLSGEPQLATHPFRELGTAVMAAENPFVLVDSLAGHVTSALGHLKALVEKHRVPAHVAGKLDGIRNLIEDAVVMEALARQNNLELVERTNPEAIRFEELYSEYKKAVETWKEASARCSRWRQKIDRADLAGAVSLAARHEQSFLGFLNGSWRRLKKQLQAAYDFSAHGVKPAFSQVLQQLQDEYREQDRAQAMAASLRQAYKVDDVEALINGLSLLRSKQGDAEVDYLLQHPESNSIVVSLSRLNNTLHQLELQLEQLLYEYRDKPLQEIADAVSTIDANRESLKELAPLLQRFSRLPKNMQDLVRKIPLTPLQAEAVLVHRSVHEIYRQNPSFAAKNGAVIQDAVQTIEKAYADLLRLNSEFIRAKRRTRFWKNYQISSASVTGLSPEERQLKKIYTDGRRVLEHEMGKSMRYKSIRELATAESGQVLKDIKPVWLMSPLSVSDSLPFDAGFFDVVIFDEASQITLEEGIPALFRAPQAIIVGDDKQMPPSNFFSSKAEDPEDLETIEGEAENEVLSADADSLLVQGARKLPGTMLRWHYRSRYESLISYSNHAFYEGGLLTIPDINIENEARPLLEITSSEEGGEKASRLLEGSISYHYLPQGVYEARSNRSEARYIAQMLRRLLLDAVPETVGVVAFSQEQQGAIEEAIGILALEDKLFEDALEKAYNRRDDGQFTGLFIKNLENVQGDERDIIIMSICYGPDANRKMLMNFGPINRKGGEKRLNVIFSRARKHMAVVASIRHHQVTNEYNDGAAYFKRFLHYAEMVSTGNLGTARVLLNGLLGREKAGQSISKGWRATTSEIKQALQEKGYLAEEDIGQSRFKCSLGIRRNASDSRFSLGIMVDDEQHYQNDDLVEQYFQRPAILRSFGWPVLVVFAKDWLASREQVMAAILRQLEGGPVVPAQEAPAPVRKEADDRFIRLLFSDDGEKFWEVALQGMQLHVRTGKQGTKGFVQVRTFESEAAAKNALDMLLGEQMENGFRPANAT